MNILCPICGGEIDPQLAEKIGLNDGSVEILREHAQSGKLVTLVQLGVIAERYLKPETIGLQAEFLELLGKLSEKQQKFVKDIAEAEEGERTKVIQQYTDEMKRIQQEVQKMETERKETLKGIQEGLLEISKKIVGAGIGKVGELITIKDLQSAFRVDEFTDKRSEEKGSDIIAEVRDGSQTAGKVVISVKYHDRWSGSFLDQLKRNLEEERTHWGMLVTKVFPTNALNERAYLTSESYFIVKPEYAAVAYYGLRQAVIVAWKAAQRAKTVEEGLKQERRIIDGLREWVSGEKFQQVTSTLGRAREAAKTTQDLVQKWQTYAQTQGNRVYEKVQEIIDELVRGGQLLIELEQKIAKTAVPVAPKLFAKKSGQRR